MEIKLKPVQWIDGFDTSRVNALGKQYLVRIGESGWVAQADDGDLFFESGHESREAAKAACEHDMLVICRYAVEVEPNSPEIPDGWQDISTAPRDGTEVICYFGDSLVYQVAWIDLYDDGCHRWCVDDRKHGPYSLRGYNDPYPTHWMPLPKPPKEVGG